MMRSEMTPGFGAGREFYIVDAAKQKERKPKSDT